MFAKTIYSIRIVHWGTYSSINANKLYFLKTNTITTKTNMLHQMLAWKRFRHHISVSIEAASLNSCVFEREKKTDTNWCLMEQLPFTSSILIILLHKSGE